MRLPEFKKFNPGKGENSKSLQTSLSKERSAPSFLKEGWPASPAKRGEGGFYFKPKIFIWLFLLTLVVIGSWRFIARAYEPEPTHHLLAEKSAELYRKAYGGLTDEEIQWIGEGAKNEDTPPRWINHFYDPKTGLGWQGERMGRVPAVAIQLLSDVGLSSEGAVSSLNWLHNQELQNKYSRYEGNRTFEKAVYDFVNGNKKEAYKTLGHSLHLLADATVPAHTRQDTHYEAAGDPGDPYEKWAKENTDLSHLDNINLKQENLSCSSVDDCLIKNAKYSNENFFSEGTVLDKAYGAISFGLKKEGDFWYGFYNDHYLFRGKKNTDNVLIELTVKDPKIHSSYWRLLSRQAVLSGAEAIRIFKEEAEKAQKDKSLLKPPPREAGILSYFLTGPGALINPQPRATFSLYGEYLKISQAGQSLWQKTKSYFSSTASSLFGAVSAPIIPSKTNKDSGQAPAGQNPPAPSPEPTVQPAPPKPETPSKPKAPEPIAKTVSLPPDTVKTAPSANMAEPSNNNGQQNPDGQSVKENIFKPKIPSQITEQTFRPFFPLLGYTPASSNGSLTQTVSVASNQETQQENSQNNQAQPEQNQQATSTEPVATSTPAAATSTQALPPEISISLSNYRVTSRSFSVDWTSTSTDVAQFEAQYKIGSGAAWQNFATSTASSAKIFEAPQDQTIYYFRVHASSTAGVLSDWAETSALINWRPIVINEIAWAGAGTSSAARSDEWIELFNKTNEQINLSGWSIVEVGEGATTTIITLNSAIGSSSYYLIERTDDNAVKDIAADTFGSFSGGGLSNSGENLYLLDEKGDIVDRVNCGNGCNIWNSNVSHGYRTIERVNPYLPSDIPANWLFNNGTTTNGRNIDNRPINGTPKSQNSVFNQEFFYLYAPQNTTATSTQLNWTESSLLNFQNYRVIRSYDSSFATTTIFNSISATNFIDTSLESETTYYYKIAACGASGNCAYSDTASTTTLAFNFSWIAPLRLSDMATTSSSFFPDITIGQDGQPIAVWFNQMLGTLRWLYYSQISGDGSWLDSSDKYISGDFMPYGNLARIFSRVIGSFDIFYSGQTSAPAGTYEILRLNKNGGQTQVWQVSDGTSSNIVPWAVFDQSGTAHIVWQGKEIPPATDIFYRAMNADGTFLAAVEKIPGSHWGKRPNIIFGQDGKLHASWYRCDWTGFCDGLYYSVNNLDGSGWGKAIKIIGFDNQALSENAPAMLSLGTSTILFAWPEQTYNIGLVEYNGTATTTRQIISPPGQKAINSLQLFFSNSQKPYLLFDGFDWPNYGAYIVSRRGDSSWRQPKTIYESNNAIRNARAALDAQNNLHVVYYGGPGNTHIFYTGSEIE